jgi:sulfate adenylyltransferase subunit 2
MTAAITSTGLDALSRLESEAIHILREVAGEFDRPVILFSGGKDSTVLLHLAVKAFWPAPVPFPLLHVDTGHNFDEVIDFRDRTVERYGLRLIVANVQSYIDDGRLSERSDGTRNPLQTVPLLDAIATNRFDAVLGGARRRGAGPRQGAHLQPAQRVRPVGAEAPAPRAVEPLQRAAPAGRARARVPAVQLD